MLAFIRLHVVAFALQLLNDGAFHTSGSLQKPINCISGGLLLGSLFRFQSSKLWPPSFHLEKAWVRSHKSFAYKRKLHWAGRVRGERHACCCAGGPWPKPLAARLPVAQPTWQWWLNLESLPESAGWWESTRRVRFLLPPIESCICWLTGRTSAKRRRPPPVFHHSEKRTQGHKKWAELDSPRSDPETQRSMTQVPSATNISKKGKVWQNWCETRSFAPNPHCKQIFLKTRSQPAGKIWWHYLKEGVQGLVFICSWGQIITHTQTHTHTYLWMTTDKCIQLQRSKKFWPVGMSNNCMKLTYFWPLLATFFHFWHLQATVGQFWLFADSAICCLGSFFCSWLVWVVL